MPLLYPLIAWGTADDISGGGWSNNGTPTVTGGQTDPFGGTGAYLIDDNDAGIAEARLKTGFVVNARMFTWAVCIKQGTSSTSLVEVRDETAADYPLILSITWSGGVPTVTPSATGGNPTPTVNGTISLGASWYLIVSSCPWTYGNSARPELYATGATVSLTGSTYYYLRHLVVMDYLDGAVSWSEPRDGSAQAQGASGTEDAWTIGTDEHLRATVRWVPDFDRASPASVSGWYGAADAPGINDGVKAMLTAGRDKGLLRFVPDRSVCTTYMDSYLVEPMRGSPDLEPNWDRKFTLELRGTTVYTGY
jgi:hypothetical protein